MICLWSICCHISLSLTLSFLCFIVSLRVHQSFSSFGGKKKKHCLFCQSSTVLFYLHFSQLQLLLLFLRTSLGVGLSFFWLLRSSDCSFVSYLSSSPCGPWMLSASTSVLPFLSQGVVIVFGLHFYSLWEISEISFVLDIFLELLVV